MVNKCKDCGAVRYIDGKYFCVQGKVMDLSIKEITNANKIACFCPKIEKTGRLKLFDRGIGCILSEKEFNEEMNKLL